MRTRIALALALTVSVFLSAGCKRGKKEADCNAAASNYATLLREQVERDSATSEEQKEQALSLMSQLKEDMAKSCEKQKWNEKTRECIATAKAQQDLERCMPKKEQAPAAGTPSGEGKSPPEGDTPESSNDEAKTP